MAHGRNKYQSRENRAKVREVLMQEWDPIGVRDALNAQDEYDSYVGWVYVMLIDQRATRETIAAHLFEIATQRMGLTETPWLSERCDRTAATLVALRPEFELH